MYLVCHCICANNPFVFDYVLFCQLYFPILFQDRWYVVVVYLNRRFIYVLDSCTLHFGAGSHFDKAVHDEFVSSILLLLDQLVSLLLASIFATCRNIRLK